MLINIILTTSVCLMFSRVKSCNEDVFPEQYAFSIQPMPCDNRKRTLKDDYVL